MLRLLPGDLTFYFLPLPLFNFVFLDSPQTFARKLTADVLKEDQNTQNVIREHPFKRTPRDNVHIIEDWLLLRANKRTNSTYKMEKKKSFSF